MSDYILFAALVASPFILWYVIKRMIYAAFYVAKKAMEDAKNKSRNKE